ncbi:MAG: HisA/HisF-related TIM barrel protein [Gammaproteobacteria bacterium]|tara:strand:- start:842 stop:1522 length:681 start_codon:yes stop_codon:yes gene_type:complete
MKLIPAIDLINNKVVLAKGGKRDHYAEIPKNIAPSSDPIAFIQYLLSLYHFSTIYLADLDSINLFNTKNSIINDIIVKYKHINFIVDNGLRHCSKINIYKAKNYQQIIGTETFIEYQQLKNNVTANYLLSLDYKNNTIISKTNKYKSLKPNSIICMSIDNIGSQDGPNYKNLTSAKKLYPDTNIIVSGGVRNMKDIFNIQKKGYKDIITMTAILEKKINYNNKLFK